MSDEKPDSSWAVVDVRNLEKGVALTRRELDNQEMDLARIKLRCMLNTELNMELPGDRKFVEDFLLEFTNANRNEAYVPRVANENDNMQLLIKRLIELYNPERPHREVERWFTQFSRDGVEYKLVLDLIDGVQSYSITVTEIP
jgi:hypothetical protein